MLVFIGGSVRALTEAAVRAGLGAHNQLVAVDFFGDRETRAAADRWIPLTPDPAGVHGLCAFLRGEGSAVTQDRRPSGSAANGVVSFVVGGGVEPWWSAWAAQLETFGRVLGPTPASLDGLGALPRLIAPFADTVCCPPRAAGRVPETGNWWIKARHRAGGLQVRPAACGAVIPPGSYAEAHVAGDEFSLGFWVDGDDTDVLCAADVLPGGQGKIEAQLVHADPMQIPVAAAALTARGASVLIGTLPRHLARTLRHKGFLGLDLIRDATGRLWLLDVNLRPTSSMLCLPNLDALLARWVRGAAEEKVLARGRRLPSAGRGRTPSADRSDTGQTLVTDPPEPGRPQPKRSFDAASTGVVQGSSGAFHLRATVFAPRELDFDPASTEALTDGLEAWLTDLPVGPQHFAEGAPVCTVRASGPERTLVIEAAEALYARLRGRLV